MQRRAPEGDPPIWPDLAKTFRHDKNPLVRLQASLFSWNALSVAVFGFKCADLGGRIWGPSGRVVANVLWFLAPGAISGRQKRRPVNVNTAPESKVQENRLVCSLTNGFF